MLPLALIRRPRVWFTRVGVLPLFQTTNTLPSTGLTTGMLPWSKLQALAGAFLSKVVAT